MNLNGSKNGQEQKSGCPLFCPGCQDRRLLPAQRLAEKELFIRKVLLPWRDRMVAVREAASDRRAGFREKVCLRAVWQDKSWRFGFIRGESLVPVHHCPLHAPRVNNTINLMAAVLPPADVFSLAWFLQSGAQVTLVVKSRHLPDMTWLKSEVKDALEQMGDKGLWLHLHPAAGRRVTAKNTWHLLWGEPRSTDANGLVYGPTAFRQLIPELAAAALDAAESFLAPAEADFVVDLYSGIGGSLRRWGRKGCRAAGVEINGESVDCARINAPAATIFRGAGRHRLPQLSAMLPSDGNQRLLYANPPRTGIEAEVMDWILAVFKPRRIACLSCNAVSLKRDLERLTGAGYKIEQIVPYDFFPGTRYLEIMALLMRESA